MIKKNIYQMSNRLHKTIALFSDIHFSKKYPEHILTEIVKNIETNKPDYICIPGDIIDDASVLTDEKLVEQLTQFLIQLSSLAPVIISYGNHDEVLLRFHKATYQNTTSFFHQLNDLSNIYFLDNSSVILGEINFIGYHPNYSYYESKEQIKFENIDDIKKNIVPNYCNILLCHSPIQILNYSLPVDYILSGHMHNGLVPFHFQKIGNNRGLVGPYYSFFPKLSRGLVTKDKTKLIITGGVRKISNSSSIVLRPFNLFYPIDIDYIQL